VKKSRYFFCFKNFSQQSQFLLIFFNTIIGWLIIYGFTSRSRIFHLNGDVTIASEPGLQNLDLCLTFMAFEQGGTFIVPHLLWHGTSVFLVSSEGPPQLVASFDTQGEVWRIYSDSDPHGFINTIYNLVSMHMHIFINVCTGTILPSNWKQYSLDISSYTVVCSEFFFYSNCTMNTCIR
jgi:hypothetical protein